MSDPVSTYKIIIKSLTDRALRSLGYGGTAEYSVEYSAISDHGEFSSNAAFACFGKLGLTAADLARKLADLLSSEKIFKEVCAASPGYVNFYMSSGWYDAVFRELFLSGQPSPGTVMFSEDDLYAGSSDPLYEYAWVCSLMRAYPSQPDPVSPDPGDPAERRLLGLLFMSPSVIEAAEIERDPSAVLRYIQDLTSAFRALRDEEGRMLGLAASGSPRLFLYGTAVRPALRNCISLFQADPTEYL